VACLRNGNFVSKNIFGNYYHKKLICCGMKNILLEYSWLTLCNVYQAVDYEKPVMEDRIDKNESDWQFHQSSLNSAPLLSKPMSELIIKRGTEKILGDLGDLFDILFFS